MRRDTGVVSATPKAFQAVNRATASGTAGKMPGEAEHVMDL
jgi:hypothetical protein